MRIIINKTGKTEDVSLKLAQRLINQGKAHQVKIEPIVVVDSKSPDATRKTFITSKKLIDIPDKVFEVPKPKKVNIESKHSISKRQLDIGKNSTRASKSKSKSKRKKRNKLLH